MHLDTQSRTLQVKLSILLGTKPWYSLYNSVVLFTQSRTLQVKVSVLFGTLSRYSLFSSAILGT